MLAVILKILGIFGIVLLILLAVFLLLLLIILFFPVKYRIAASKNSEDLIADIKISWLFGLLRAKYRYPKPGKLKIKLLCFTLFPKEKQNDAQDRIQNETRTEEKSVSVAESAPAGKTHNAEETAEAISNNTEKAKKSIKEKILAKYENIKYTICNICDKIKYIWDNITFYKDLLFHEDTKALIKHIFQRLQNILKKLKPKRIKADILFGTGQPDTTGYVLGVYGVLSTQIHKPNVINLTPDFENKVIEGRVEASGRFRIFTLLKNGIMIILDKRLKELLSKFKKHKAAMEALNEQKGK
ncbi:MAG: DUF2953 domain-containing protein [Lachnospiraceae bacterium]|nr:DUF2953 domain-containing protein [Lachnospiraceae bacterium]